MSGWARHALAFAPLVVGALAVQVQHGNIDGDSPAILYGDTQHLTSPIAADKPGNYELLRMPRERSAPALLSIRGTFDDIDQLDEMECHGLYMKNLTLKGDWLDGKVVHFQWKNGLQMKVSSMQPAFAGPWRLFESYESWHSASEELPSALRLRQHENASYFFQLGPAAAEAGLSLLVTAENPGLAAIFFNASKLVLDDRQVRRRTEECWQVVGPQYSVFNYFHDWNLGAAAIALDEQGTHEMLRLPKEKANPALLRVRGTVEASLDAPCGLSLTALSFDGAWFGSEATLHVSLSPDMVYKVTTAASEGQWEGIEKLRLDDPYSTFKGLPETVKLLTDADDSGATTGFRLFVGPSASLEGRPLLDVSKGNSGLSLYYIKRFTTEPVQRVGADCGNITALNTFRTKLYRVLPGFSHLSGAAGRPYTWKA